MGNRTTQYSGTFDGNNKTVSGLYFNGDSTCIGLFGSSESDGNIKNVGVVDSYFKGNDHVGGVCGNNAGTITNCYNAGNLTAIESSATIGGICGYNNGEDQNRRSIMRDYSKYEKTPVLFSGAEKKFEIIIDGFRYIVKFQKNSEVGLTFNYVSEYLGSHIFQLLGIPVQETFLGTYEGKNVVVMKNFLEPEDDLVAFNGVGESSLERDKELYQYTYEDITAMLRENMKSTNVEETIDRFWDMFIVDALIGNFDRHGGNWGFIKKDNQYRIAPVYDNGSSLYPKLNTDEKLEAVLSSEEEIDQRIYRFPTSHIKVKNRKSSYFEVISSLQFEACNDALKRIVPRIDFNQINTLIDEAEGISEVRKRFYKVMLQQRYEKILMYAYRQL